MAGLGVFRKPANTNLLELSTMPWRRIVIRSDSIIRFWSLAFLDCAKGYSSVYDSPALKAIEFNTHLALSDGSEHIRTEEMMTLARGLMEASKEYPLLFQKIGRHYERIGHQWLRFLERVRDSDLQSTGNRELKTLVQRFAQYYAMYAPILYVPFVVERRYAAEYPQLLSKIADRLLSEATSRVNSQSSLRLLAHGGAISLPETSSTLQDSIRGVIEHSVRRTMAEEKEICLLEIASLVENDPRTSRLFAAEEAPRLDSARKVAPEIFDRLEEALARYSWIKHWGYPPRYTSSTIEEFLEDVHRKVQGGATATLSTALRREKDARRDYQTLLRLADLDPSERQLIDDINYYNFLRTYRMEIKIKAQNLSIPLFREIERRAREMGKLEKDDIFLMTPPEMIQFLENGSVPPDVVERREHWALMTHAKSGEWKVLTSTEYERLAEGFFGVIDYRENARGPHNATTPFVGGKAANLFKLVELGYEIPPFFVVSTDAFCRHVERASVKKTIARLLADLSKDTRALEEVSGKLREVIEGIEVSEPTREAMHRLFEDLKLKKVAVRSSATLEDSAQYSWAGRFESLLDVDIDGLEEALKQVWASLFSAPALSYATEAGVDLGDVPMAVIVQTMIPAEASGVLNTAFDTANLQWVEIEVALGYGAPIVSGEVTPDRYIVEMDSDARIVKKEVSRQERMLTSTGWEEIPGRKGSEPKLPVETVLELARIGKRLEKDLGWPQDVEFAIVGEKIFILQARPLTAFSAQQERKGAATPAVPVDARLVATGLKGKTAEVLTGTAQVLRSLEEGRRFKDGNILVIHAATPAWDPIAFRASALVTNEGGATSHAIRVANERRFPAVVGTGNATETIEDGDQIVVDTSSDIFKGKVFVL
jgi:phosphohistidine swiveling domain-containing protein